MTKMELQSIKTCFTRFITELKVLSNIMSELLTKNVTTLNFDFDI